MPVPAGGGWVMKRIASSILALLLLVSPAFSQSTTIVKSGPYNSLGFCQITSAVSAVPLATSSCSTGSVPNGASIMEICVETSGIRYRDDGVAPTTSVGIPVVPASSSIPNCYAYAIKNLSKVQFIAISGSIIIDISFYGY